MIESYVNQMLGQSTSVWNPRMTPRQRYNAINDAAHDSCSYVETNYAHIYRGQTCPRQ
jgi:hypothetical protein